MIYRSSARRYKSAPLQCSDKSLDTLPCFGQVENIYGETSFPPLIFFDVCGSAGLLASTPADCEGAVRCSTAGQSDISHVLRTPHIQRNMYVTIHNKADRGSRRRGGILVSLLCFLQSSLRVWPYRQWQFTAGSRCVIVPHPGRSMLDR